PTYTWAPKGFNVLVVADSYLYGSGTGTGGIDLTGTAGGTGTAGVAGTPGVQSAENPVDGGPGGPGGTGGAGGPAQPSTGLARTLDPITLRAAGGAGGPGGVGGKGGNGTAGRVINRIPPIIIEPTSPGPGGNGGTGGAGGPAGAVTVGYVTPGPRGTPQYPLTSAVGGAGGPGGAAGAGGTGGINSPARAGSPGAQGAAGGNAAVTVTHGDDAAFWAAVAARLTPANRNTWGNHRLRVGRYLYRTFNAADPAHQGDLFAAYREFQAVVALGTPDSPAATQWSTWITNNLNALGLPYDIWLKPDFDGFQAIYLGYAPTLIPLVQAVTQLLNT